MLELLRLMCPFPTVDKDKRLQDGLFFSQPHFCLRCKDKDCWNHLQSSQLPVSHFTCPRGPSLFLFTFPDGQILVNGVLGKMINTTCPSVIRKQLQDHKVSIDEVQRWYRAITQAMPIIGKQAGKNMVDAVNSLHDVATGVNLVMRNAEAIMADVEGQTQEEKIDNAPPLLKSLFYSVQLMHRRLRMPSFITNPQSVAHGQKHPTPVHRLFYKMVRMFEQIAAAKRVFIRITGSSLSTPLCYDSFETIALVLIDNAIKYSERGHTVIVDVNDVRRNKCVQVSVASEGPPVPEDMRESIFNPGVRAPNATTFASAGSGLGLAIAKVVADAHGFKITYSCADLGTAGSGNGRIARNIFSFDVPI